MNRANSTIKNYSFNMIGKLWEALTDIAILAILARSLGVSRFGDYAFVMAFVAVFRVLCGISLPVIVTREIAIDRDKAPSILSAALIMQISMSLLTLLGIIMIINGIHTNPMVIRATYLAAVGIVFDFLSILFISVARGFERMEYSAYRIILRQTVFLVILVLLVQREELSLSDIFTLFWCSHFIGFLYSAGIVFRRFVKPVVQFNPQLCYYLFKQAFPVAARRLIRKLTVRIDTLLLNFLKSNVEVGLFHGAYKILQGLMFIGDSLVISIFPVLSRYYQNAADSLDGLYDRSFRFLAIVGGFLGIMLFSFANEIIAFVLGAKYVAAGNVLKIFSFLIIFMFLTKLAERMLIAGRKQLYVTLIALIALAVNTIFDLVLIPRLGIIGASLATFLAEIILFSLGIYYTYKFVSRQSVYVGSLKVLFIYCLANLIVELSASHFGNILGFLSGILFYFLGVFVFGMTKTVERHEVKEFISKIFKRQLQIDQS